MKTIKLKVSDFADIRSLLGDIALSGYRTWAEEEKRHPNERPWVIMDKYVYIEVPDDAVV